MDAGKPRNACFSAFARCFCFPYLLEVAVVAEEVVVDSCESQPTAVKPANARAYKSDVRPGTKKHWSENRTKVYRAKNAASLGEPEDRVHELKVRRLRGQDKE